MDKNNGRDFEMHLADSEEGEIFLTKTVIT